MSDTRARCPYDYSRVNFPDDRYSMRIDDRETHLLFDGEIVATWETPITWRYPHSYNARQIAIEHQKSE